MKNCPLCDILTNETSRIVYRDERVFIALNFEPLKSGHLMVLPTKHVENLSDLDPDSAQAFLGGIDKAMNVLTKFSDETPICIINGWAHRSQPHLHAHVLPQKYGLRGLFSRAEQIPDRARVEMSELEEVSEKIKNLISQ